MKRIALLLLVCCSLMLQGCFDIIEQVLLKKDGSGNFQLVLNLSRSKTKINSIMKMKTINGHPVPTKEEIKQKVADIENTVKRTPGISNVSMKLDWDNYIATFSCNFNNVTSLNTAAKLVSEKEKNSQPGIEKNYEYDKTANVFTRFNRFSLKESYDKLSNADREVFSSAAYTGIFRFEKEVKSSSNKDSKIAANKKAVMLKQNALDIITNKKTIENKITLAD